MGRHIAEESWLYDSNYSTDNYCDRKNPEIRKAKKELLKESYSPSKRKQELVCVTLFFILYPLAVLNVVKYFSLNNLLPVIIGGFFGILIADFASGLVHWGADTWGTLSTPLVGSTFIRSFREHHVSPTAMVNHDFVETNADNLMLTIPTLFMMANKDLLANSVDGIDPSFWDLFSISLWIMTVTGVALTNQIHKWAHTQEPPQIVKILQKSGIILAKKNHSVHHKPAFDGYYCITTGWLNPILDKTGFWRIIENLVKSITGMQPREDDYKWTGLSDKNPQIVQEYLNNIKK